MAEENKAQSKGGLSAVRIQLFGNGSESQPVRPPAGKIEIGGRTFPVSAALALALRSQQEALQATEGAVVQNVAVGTKQHEALLAIGFGMSVEEARQIIKERDENPLVHDYTTYTQAKAMIRQLETVPLVTSTKIPWHRERNHEL